MAKSTGEDAISQWNAGLYNLGVTRAAKKLGIERRAFGKMLKRAADNGTEVKGREKSESDKPGFSVKDFSALFNKRETIPKKIRARLDSLGDQWRYEADFAREAGVSLVDLGHVRAEFEENIVATRRDGSGRVWARAAIAAKLREML
jgi:hypothetical protein